MAGDAQFARKIPFLGIGAQEPRGSPS
jgi:hypothetical protein